MLFNFDILSIRCKICSKTWQTKKDLNRHMSFHKAVDTKKHCCSECGKVFSSKFYLNQHKKTHQDKATRSLPCKYCDKKYVNNHFILCCRTNNQLI